MKAKPVALRERAYHDLGDAIDYYFREVDDRTAQNFVASFEKRLEAIGRTPALGSPRYAHELGIVGLRSLSLRHFPYIVIYMELADHIEVWRILHSASDIPAWLGESEQEH